MLAMVVAEVLVIVIAFLGIFSSDSVQALNVFRTRSVVYNNPQWMYKGQDIYGYSVSDFIGNPNTNLAFINATSDPNVFTLAILVNSDAGIQDPVESRTLGKTSRVVWEANRDHPVRLNASLSLEKDGNVVLRDVDGSLVWSTGTSNKGTSRVELEVDTANLVVYNSTNGVLWQSSDHPSDTVVAGSVLKPGMMLQSRTSLANGKSGIYSLVMEPGGLVMYSNASGSPEPYWVRGYYQGRDDLQAAQRTCQSPTMASLVLGVGGFLLKMSPSNLTADQPTLSPALCSFKAQGDLAIRPWPLPSGNKSFIRLEHDGHLRSYALIMEGVDYSWDISDVFPPSGQSCLVPEKCQPFGTCSNNQCVGCLSSDGQRTDGWGDKCSPPIIETCASSDYQLVPMDAGTEYVSNRYLVNSLSSNNSLESCKEECLRNCSCRAAFYWQESNSCFIQGKVTTLLNTGNQSHLAFLKVTRPRGGRGVSKFAIAGSAVGAVVLFLAVLGTVLAKRWNKLKQQEEDYDSDAFLESLESVRPTRFSRADLEAITNNFSKLLGSGGFGGVYEGVLPDSRKVAVKKLESTGQGKKEFYAEVAVLGTLHHGNLVKLLGFCSEGANRLLVYEHVANGSLDRWIFRELASLGWKARMDVLLGTARGLAYLHEECTQRIIHLDIKPQNILLDELFVAKVADFGLSRLMTRDQSFVVTTLRGTPGYLAPEWLLEAAITEKSDVYSFGIVVLEVVSGKKSFVKLPDRDVHLPALALELARQSRYMELVDPRLEDIQEGEANRVIRIAFQCIQGDPSLRPSMSKVVQMLEGFCEVPAIPSRGLLFQHSSMELQSSGTHNASPSAITWHSRPDSTTVSLLSAR